MTNPVGVGLVGCGAISGEYLRRGKLLPNFRVIACSDLNPDAAKAKAAQFDIPRACTTVELLADPQVELVLNLTVPKAHAPLVMAALDAGKHIYVEKPLATTRKEGKALLAKAAKRKLLLGCAPDTFMGHGLQTARRAIDQGRIGRPTAFTALLMWPGHESWHPNPEFHYDIGGGPMFDMGPYYLTALMNLLGPVKRICGLASIAIPKRTITSQPKFGKVIKVKTPDHVTGSIEFQNGVVGTIVTSFAAHYGPSGTIEVYGTEGTLHVPDPNKFDGDVRLRRIGQSDWTVIPPVFTHDYGRSVGLADMADAIGHGRKFRATGRQALAVLDLMQGFLESSAKGRHYLPTVAYRRPEPMPIDKPFGVFA